MAYQANSVNGFPLGTFYFPNVSFPKVWQAAINTGDTDLYTCPSGRRAIILACYFTNNSGVGNIVAYVEAKISSVYYRLSANATITNGTINNTANPQPFILEAGQGFSINSTTNNGLTAGLRVIEFDNSSPLKTVSLLSLSAGNNTLYTVPTGKTALLLSSTGSSQPSLPGFQFGFVFYGNTSTVNRTVSMNAVPSGGSVGGSNLILASTTVANNNFSSPTIQFNLFDGDFINVNTDANTATQIAWVNVYEF